MIIYENEKYTVIQSDFNKHVMLIDNETEKMICHAQRDEHSPFMTEAEGKKFLDNYFECAKAIQKWDEYGEA